MRLKKTIGVLTVALAGTFGSTAHATGWEFPASILCGNGPTNDRIIQGEYRVFVNIKNPTNRTFTIDLELTQTFPLVAAPSAAEPFTPADMTPLESVTLAPGQAVMIGCKELGLENVSNYLSGILSVQAPRRTQVVLTQTAGAVDGTVNSISVTPIRPVR